jgi:Fe-S-cluster containining protein
MKRISEKEGSKKLADLKDAFRTRIVDEYEFRAKSCQSCETKGACCLDAHFVNVHISRLEAVAMRRKLDALPIDFREIVDARIGETIEHFKLDEAIDTFAATYACPLFEKGIGCLVHDVKPAACIAHACYERKEDLPPDQLLDDVEAEIERLNRRTYGASVPWLPIPVGLKD